ncbi:MAG: toll/interleukin-1 receptor domain-containing protein [Akkermansiaceae bacterium]|nr:toll/interleukin-1 receptor domain-containing protein [Akkermansiaceae bacterium]
MLRSIRKNLVNLESQTGIPFHIKEMQKRLVDNVSKRNYVVEEIFGVNSEKAESWLTEKLQFLFHKNFSDFNFNTPHFEFENEAYNDLLSIAAHSGMFNQPSPFEVCATATKTGDIRRILGWCPSPEIKDRIIANTYMDDCDGQEDPLPGFSAAMPEAYEGREDFLFVSYSRSDAAAIAPILLDLINNGVRIWYDKGILGGSEWDAKLEEKINHCRAVLLFVTPAAIASKYVRREVKYADALGKTIVSVILKETAPTHGMAMLLSQYQVLNLDEQDFNRRLMTSIRALS